MKRIGALGALATCFAFAFAGLVWSAPPASAATPGGVFVTGHDPDFHAGTQGARNIIQRAVAYVTSGKAKPRMLLVTGVTNPGPEYLDPRNGMRMAGFTFDVADHGSGTRGILDLRNVNFSDYDVIVVSSDFGGWLRQAELDVLKQRSGDLIDFVNNGGGLVAFAESGGPRASTTHDRFTYLPFVVSELPRDQQEAGFKVTPEGAAIGLVDSDVNGNYSHNIFSEAGGLNVIDNDATGNPMALAARGLFVSPEGVPALSIDDVTVTENIIGNANAQLATRNNLHWKEKQYLTAAIASEDDRIAALTEQQEKEKAGADADREELERVQALFNQKTLPITRLIEARRTILLSSTRHLQTVAQRGQSERDRAELAAKLTKLADQRRDSVLAELQLAEVELAATRSRLQAVGDKMIYTGLVRSQLVRGKDAEPSIVIYRKAEQATQALDVNQDAELRPGDVIDVALQKKLPETSASSKAPAPKSAGH